eukprot:7389483-Prymnesium_polylepis.1
MRLLSYKREGARMHTSWCWQISTESTGSSSTTAWRGCGAACRAQRVGPASSYPFACCPIACRVCGSRSSHVCVGSSEWVLGWQVTRLA